MLVVFLIVFYLLLGTFMESLSMMVTTIPILVPALISPPEGLNLYVIHGIRKSVHEEAGAASGTITDLYAGVLPFMAGMAIVLVLLVAFPQAALWLPNLMKGT